MAHDKGIYAPLVHSSGGPQTAALAEEAVAADGDGGVAGGGRAPGAGGEDGAGEIASDHGVLHDDGLATQHDVLGADEGGFAGDLVARVLQTEARRVRLGGGGGRLRGILLCRTVSMYSPLGARRDMLGRSSSGEARAKSRLAVRPNRLSGVALRCDVQLGL